MAASTPDPSHGADIPELPDEALLDLLESIQEPAFLYLPGGRIAGVNRAAAMLSDVPAIGMTLGELIERHETRRADGSSLVPGDLPYARALRGEIVAHGERITMVFPDGTSYRALVTSTPIVIDGKVVAALSVWHDFDDFVRGLASPTEPPGGPAEGT